MLGKWGNGEMRGWFEGFKGEKVKKKLRGKS
jgi:hypothetical protein